MPRGFTSWGQFMAMLFCQLGRAHSLREICGGLACCEGQLKHLGVPVAPKMSTLAYANEHRPWESYQTVFEQTLFKCQELVESQGGRKKFRFKNKLLSLDGSIIDLSVSMFDWAKYKRTHRLEIVRLVASLDLIELIARVIPRIVGKITKTIQRIAKEARGPHDSDYIQLDIACRTIGDAHYL